MKIFIIIVVSFFVINYAEAYPVDKLISVINKDLPRDQFIETLSQPIKKEITCLALNMYHEGRETNIDEWAVGHVTRNRVNLHDKSYCDVVFSKLDGFSWTKNKKIKKLVPHEIDEWNICLSKAYLLYIDPEILDITNGSTNFVSASMPSQHWMRAAINVQRLGHNRYFLLVKENS